MKCAPSIPPCVTSSGQGPKRLPGANEIAYRCIDRPVFRCRGHDAGCVKNDTRIGTPSVVAVAVPRPVILSKEIAHLARRRFRTELPIDVSDGVTLYFAQRAALVRGAGDAYCAAVVLAVALLPVSTEEKPPVIGDFRPDDGEQFRIGCLPGL